MTTKKIRNTSIEIAKKITSEYRGVSIEDMESKSRIREYAQARQQAMYILKKYTKLSLKAIGAAFGNRDHSTVIHAVQTTEDLMYSDKQVKIDIEILTNKFLNEIPSIEIGDSMTIEEINVEIRFYKDYISALENRRQTLIENENQ